jgi:hypothetical protein
MCGAAVVRPVSPEPEKRIKAVCSVWCFLTGGEREPTSAEVSRAEIALVQDARYRLAPCYQRVRRHFPLQRYGISLRGCIIAPHTLSDIVLALFRGGMVPHFSILVFRKPYFPGAIERCHAGTSSYFIPTGNQRDGRLRIILIDIGPEEHPIQSTSRNAGRQQNGLPRHASRSICGFHEQP